MATADGSVTIKIKSPDFGVPLVISHPQLIGEDYYIEADQHITDEALGADSERACSCRLSVRGGFGALLQRSSISQGRIRSASAAGRCLTAEGLYVMAAGCACRQPCRAVQQY